LGDAGGKVELTVEHPGEAGTEGLRVTITDDGKGLPEDFDPTSNGRLGLQIVHTLVESELGGRFTIGPAPSGRGTRAVIDLPPG